MTISPRTFDTTGNHEILDGIQLSYDTMTNTAVPVATQPSVVCGTGAPTFSATKGTLYIRLDGSSTVTRLYINTTGSTTWTTIASAA